MQTSNGVTQELVERLSRASSLLVFTGAGVSRESGVPTFRGEDGYWHRYKPEELASWAAFESDPELVWRWYDYRRQLLVDVEPNAAHEAIAALGRGFDDFLLVTQNVDGLHSRAGSVDPVELHGNIWRARCTREHTVTDFMEVPLKDKLPKCVTCGALLRPDVVWYGEPLPAAAYDCSYQGASECDAMIVVGTSSVVRPAASLPLVAKHNGAFVVEVNTGYTPISALIDETLIGRAGEIMPELAEGVLSLMKEKSESEAAAGGLPGRASS